MRGFFPLELSSSLDMRRNHTSLLMAYLPRIARHFFHAKRKWRTPTYMPVIQI